MLDKIQEHILSEINRLDNADKKILYNILQNKNNINQANYNIKNNEENIKNNEENIDILHNTMRNVVSVGADVVRGNNRDRSWAVICIEGNYNIVKFIDMHGADYRYILDFLKQFEGSRMVIDAPPFAYFEDGFKMK